MNTAQTVEEYFSGREKELLGQLNTCLNSWDTLTISVAELEPEPEPPELYHFDPRRTGTGTVSLL